VIKVWGGKSVANVQKVLWFLGEACLPFEYCGPTGTFASPADQRYIASKAPGSAPLMDDDGFVLWEGNAIVRHLARKYAAGTLWPSDPKTAAEADRWMDYQLSTVREHIHPILRADLTPADIAERAQLLAIAFDPVEAALEGRLYLAGDDFTVADIPLGINAYRWFGLDVKRPSVPNIEAWYRRFRARPAFRTHVVPWENARVAFKAG
jgi:glutathione S-transferase